MLSAAKIFALITVALSVGLGANADTIQGFSSAQCSGASGLVVPCDGSCHQFTDRISLKLTKTGTGTQAQDCIRLYKNTGCNNEAVHFNWDRNGCANRPTGGEINSFRCYSSTC